MLADVAETFDNLRRINMKLNPKKCSFGVKEGKFLGYMVTFEGIRANPAKTKDIAEIQSPRTWGEMQSLAGKLAALNQKAENAFQELKKTILNLPTLTTPRLKETLFVYLAASKEAVSVVLLVIRQGKQHPVHYVSRTLHDAERNYAPLEKMALALRHTARRLAQYFVELGAYNITYKPHNAIKGQILADFINEIPVLYTDGASSAKGSDAGLFLITPTKTEYTYALRLNFESTNNQAEYEALLAGLRIAKKIGVQSLSVNVDSKLVSSKINSNYEACKENMIRSLGRDIRHPVDGRQGNKRSSGRRRGNMDDANH
ncbi:reverse transcriptase domain-containing protein [Tanacetum coccineum]